MDYEKEAKALALGYASGDVDSAAYGQAVRGISLALRRAKASGLRRAADELTNDANSNYDVGDGRQVVLTLNAAYLRSLASRVERGEE